MLDFRPSVVMKDLRNLFSSPLGIESHLTQLLWLFAAAACIVYLNLFDRFSLFLSTAVISGHIEEITLVLYDLSIVMRVWDVASNISKDTFLLL
jgi:hypothetical protein